MKSGGQVRAILHAWMDLVPDRRLCWNLFKRYMATMAGSGCGSSQQDSECTSCLLNFADGDDGKSHVNILWGQCWLQGGTYSLDIAVMFGRYDFGILFD